MSNIVSRPGQYPHIEWLNIRDDGTLSECAIMKKDREGNHFFFELNSLDDIDKRRLVRIVTNRNARNFPLWDLMSQTTLNNGINALEYFHQYVKMLTPSGTVLNPRTGEVGYRIPTQQTQQVNEQQPAPQPQQPAPQQQTVAENTQQATPQASKSTSNRSSSSRKSSSRSTSKK